MGAPAKKTHDRETPYDSDTVGRMFQRNAHLIRLLILSRDWLDKVPLAVLTPKDVETLDLLKHKIDAYHRSGR